MGISVWHANGMAREPATREHVIVLVGRFDLNRWQHDAATTGAIPSVTKRVDRMLHECGYPPGANSMASR